MGRYSPSVRHAARRNVRAISAINRDRGIRTIWVGQVLNVQALEGDEVDGWLPLVRDKDVWPLQQRFNEKSGVSIDLEMSRLLTLQNAYGANARVMTTVQQMFDILLQM